MNKSNIFAAIIFCLIACKSNNKNQAKLNNDMALQHIADTASTIFPLTSFLKGEVRNIKKGGITPMIKHTINSKIDSTFLKIQSIDSAVAEFLDPIIDSLNCKNIFVEKRFLDQTINAFTFTYDPKPNTQNIFAFVHWDIYIDPDTEKVTRAYLIKKIAADKTVQLTWVVGKYCTINTINNITSKLESSTKISWSYN